MCVVCTVYSPVREEERERENEERKRKIGGRENLKCGLDDSMDVFIKKPTRGERV